MESFVKKKLKKLFSIGEPHVIIHGEPFKQSPREGRVFFAYTRKYIYFKYHRRVTNEPNQQLTKKLTGCLMNLGKLNFLWKDVKVF